MGVETKEANFKPKQTVWLEMHTKLEQSNFLEMRQFPIVVYDHIFIASTKKH